MKGESRMPEKKSSGKAVKITKQKAGRNLTLPPFFKNLTQIYSALADGANLIPQHYFINLKEINSQS